MLAVIGSGLSSAVPPQIHSVGNIAHPVKGGYYQRNQNQYVLLQAAFERYLLGIQFNSSLLQGYFYIVEISPDIRDVPEGNGVYGAYLLGHLDGIQTCGHLRRRYGKYENQETINDVIILI